jgi:hypothetical protein
VKIWINEVGIPKTAYSTRSLESLLADEIIAILPNNQIL